MREPDERGVLTNPALTAQGWTRRYLAAPERAQEAAETYAAAGFEVRLEPLTPSDLGSACAGCAATVCASYLMVYTRKEDG